MSSATSSRTAGPNRRRASSRSSACSRSSSRSSSTSKSALRVTRNRWCSTTSMPGNSSAGARRSGPRAAGTSAVARGLRPGTNRGTLLGTLTRANRSAAGVRVAHEHGQVQRQPGDVGERVRRVDRQRGEHREDLGAEVLGQRRRCSSVVEVVPAHDPDALVGQRRLDVVEEAAARAGRPAPGCARRSARSCSRGGQPVGGAHRQAHVSRGASGRRRGPCRTRRGCWRRSRGTSPAPAAAGSGPRPAPAPGR